MSNPNGVRVAHTARVRSVISRFASDAGNYAALSVIGRQNGSRKEATGGKEGTRNAEGLIAGYPLCLAQRWGVAWSMESKYHYIEGMGDCRENAVR